MWLVVPLLSDDGNVISPEQDNGSGVDICVVTSSAAQPLRLVLAGLVGELSLDSLRRAAAGTYSSVEDVIALLGAGRKTDDMRAKSILAVQPDAVCIAGGTDNGSTVPVLNLVESVALGASLIEPLARPTLVYAGNSALRARVKEIVGNDVPLIAVEGNVRPALATEDLGPLQAELEALACQHEIGRRQRPEHVRGVEPYAGAAHCAQFRQCGALPQHDRRSAYGRVGRGCRRVEHHLRRGLQRQTANDGTQ